MKISLDWLSDFVTWTLKDPAAIANRITLGSAEVEEVETQGALLDHCCVGNILTVEKHPNADRLSVCTVETDQGVKTVVCGGTNVRAGMLVAFAHVGATVMWHGGEMMTLEPVKIRGVSSEGMICAAEELDLADMFPPKPEDGERPIIDFTGKKLKTGTSLREALGLTDVILHINNTAITTRPDLFSHIGFARECVALGLAKWKRQLPDMSPPRFADAAAPKITTQDPTLVPRYHAATLHIDPSGETPDWMKKRLAAVGVRSITLPIDITNYVMFELGAPLHAFDASHIHGASTFRASKADEVVTTLDGIKRTLPKDTIVMEDEQGLFDLCGIMGDQRSSCTEKTTEILLHAPVYDPIRIRRSIQTLNHRTDAATIYEKGMPAIAASLGFARALRLFVELCPNASVTSGQLQWGTDGSAPTIPVSLEHIQSRIGVDIAEKDVTRILKDLEFDVRKGPKKGNLTVTPPLHRLRDIEGEHDVIEEVGRIFGFDNVPEVMPEAMLRIPQRDNRIHSLRDQLKADRFVEIVPLSFVSAQLLKKAGLDPSEAVEVENPLGDETALLQTSTLPHLLAHAQQNLLLAGDTLRSFQWSHVFHKDEPERLELGLLHTSRVQTDLLHDPFLQLKEELLHAIGAANEAIDIEAAKDVPAIAHPGRAAVIRHGNDIVGYLFEIHPMIRANFDMVGRAAAAVLDLTTLFALKPASKPVEALPAYPSISYDVTLTRTHQKHIAHLLQEARRASELLEDVVIHDLYAGKPLKEGEYNATLRFTYRSAEKTLTDDEAKAAHAKVMKSIKG
ncbi:MAG TPA: phenylalanine--tRNA ligase subunit beta [Candidatus Peribacteraceae bacterium]|nr:phenylalanine--tRNA ligase subunit beta [Candidatus Peribacteraceae bacterium]